MREGIQRRDIAIEDIRRKTLVPEKFITFTECASGVTLVIGGYHDAELEFLVVILFYVGILLAYCKTIFTYCRYFI